jgi:hypothetical protein
MAKIKVFHRKNGEFIMSAEDLPEGGVKFIGPDALLKGLPAGLNVTQLTDLFASFSDKMLVKSEGIEILAKEDDGKEDTEAQPNAPTPNASEQISGEDVSKRIEPALTILREILKRAEQKRQERAELQAHQQAMELERQNAEVVLENDGLYYVTMDGDNIGNQVARAQYTDDEAKVKEISQRIDLGMRLFIQWAGTYSGTVIEAGGDEGQVKVPQAALDYIEEFRQNYFKQVGATVTVGVGKTISQSIQARELGKLRGKNQVVYWDENTEKELNLRLQQKGNETPEKKLIESGVISQPQEQPKLGEQVEAPKRIPKYGLPKGSFAEAQKQQQEYEDWLRSQKKEVTS